MIVSFAPGIHYGYRFDAQGRVIAWSYRKTTKGTRQVADQRQTIPTQSGTWLHMVGGIFPDYWVRESGSIVDPDTNRLPVYEPPAPDPAPVPAPEPAPASTGSGLLTSAAELASRPTIGTAWASLKAAADGSWGTPTIYGSTGQNSRHGVLTLAGALVYARTGTETYRTKVVDSLRQVEQLAVSISNGGELAVARNLAAWVFAADLTGYRSAALVAKLRELLTAVVDDHPIWNRVNETSEISANNHGTFCTASVLAYALWTGNRTAADKCWAIFRRYSDATAPWTRFSPTSDYRSGKGAQWQNGTAYLPINPPGIKDGRDLDGCLVEEAVRGTYPDAPSGGYCLEALQCLALMGVLFERAGYPAWAHGNRAVKRAADWMVRAGIWNYHAVGYHVAWVLNRAYGTTYPTQPAGYGRLLGWTDWLYG